MTFFCFTTPIIDHYCYGKIFKKIGKKQEQIKEKAEFVEKVTFEPLDKFQTKPLWKLLQPL